MGDGKRAVAQGAESRLAYQSVVACSCGEGFNMNDSPTWRAGVW
jgi:hypothetical protein